MKTNSKAVRESIRQHILECVTNDNGDTFATFATFTEAKAHLAREFARCGDLRIKNNRARFQDYLMGIPFGFEYTNEGIVDFLNGLGINPTGKEFPVEKAVALYAYLIFRETV